MTKLDLAKAVDKINRFVWKYVGIGGNEYCYWRRYGMIGVIVGVGFIVFVAVVVCILLKVMYDNMCQIELENRKLYQEYHKRIEDEKNIYYDPRYFTPQKRK